MTEYKYKVGDIVSGLYGQDGWITKIDELDTSLPYLVQYKHNGPFFWEEESALMAQTAEPEASTHDAVQRPDYYVLPNGRQVIEISQWLTSAGAQAVQYIARATRLDGVVKGERIQDIDKAIFWLNIEKKRLEEHGD